MKSPLTLPGWGTDGVGAGGFTVGTGGGRFAFCVTVLTAIDAGDGRILEEAGGLCTRACGRARGMLRGALWRGVLRLFGIRELVD